MIAAISIIPQSAKAYRCDSHQTLREGDQIPDNRIPTETYDCSHYNHSQKR
jgi:hypothetical protein